MAKRILASIVGLPLIIIIIYLGGYYLQASIMFLALVGMYEFYKVITEKRSTVQLVSYLAAIIYIGFLPYLSGTFFLLLMSLFIISLLFCTVIFHEKINIQDCALALFGFCYIPFLMSYVYLVRAFDDGVFLVWLIFISAWGSDTFAYFTGITIGKHKLCPKLSPKKTIEGSVGGVIGATALAVIYALCISDFYSPRHINVVLSFAIVGAVGAIFSQFGDLAASAIKRFTGAKDYGNLIPGHGGVLDRFDSILFTAPGVFIVTVIISLL